MSLLDTVQSIDPKYAKEICAVAKTFLESHTKELGLGNLIAAAGPLAQKAQTFVELKGSQKAAVVVDGLCAYVSEHAPLAKEQKDALIAQVRQVLPSALTLLVDASRGAFLVEQARGFLAPLLACLPSLVCKSTVALAPEEKKVPVSSTPPKKEEPAGTLEVRTVEGTNPAKQE